MPWHINSIRGIETAKHTLLALDGIKDLVKVNEEAVRPQIREMKMRAILMMEEIIESGGYFEAVEQGFFVDNGQYPERNGAGIARMKEGGIGAGTVVAREDDYYAPVCEHFGYNNIPEGLNRPDEPIGMCTLEDRSKIKYIDELDESDNVNQRIATQLEDRKGRADRTGSGMVE